MKKHVGLKKDIEKIEALQRTFTSRIEDLSEFNYHERLKVLNLYSLQRRRERFCIITLWKIANNLHPNILNLDFYDTPRFGLKCRRKVSKAKRVHTRTLQHNSFTSTAPALFNTIPKSIKDKTTLSAFKSSLDKYLQTIPDLPPISGYPIQNGNSLLEWRGRSGHYYDAASSRFNEVNDSTEGISSYKDGEFTIPVVSS